MSYKGEIENWDDIPAINLILAEIRNSAYFFESKVHEAEVIQRCLDAEEDEVWNKIISQNHFALKEIRDGLSNILENIVKLKQNIH